MERAINILKKKQRQTMEQLAKIEAQTPQSQSSESMFLRSRWFELGRCIVELEGMQKFEPQPPTVAEELTKLLWDANKYYFDNKIENVQLVWSFCTNFSLNELNNLSYFIIWGTKVVDIHSKEPNAPIHKTCRAELLYKGQIHSLKEHLLSEAQRENTLNDWARIVNHSIPDEVTE